MARPRIADVAREAGVSKTAVSFAFNDPGRLSPRTAARIRDVAVALGYRPHPVARMLSQGQARAVGILTPQALSVAFSNPFFGQFAQGVAGAIEDAGYAIHFLSPAQGSLARAIDRAIVDGIVAVGLSPRHPEVGSVERSGLPVVLVDSGRIARLSSVEIDDAGGAAQAARHILDLGHRDVLIVAVESAEWAKDDPDSVPSRRLRGYLKALDAGGARVEPGGVVTASASVEGGRSAIRAAWASGRRPSAILAMSDAMAIGAIRAAGDLGLAVPGDLSVVGFDDIDFAQHIDPPLTTVHQPVRRKGEAAARSLLSQIDGSADGGPTHVRLETRLVVRSSTGPPGGRRERGTSDD
jgi:alanine racemase